MKMPESIFIALITVLSIMGGIAFVILIHSIWIWIRSRTIWKRYALRLPIYRRGEPNPLQWLIDEADKQRDNPVPYLVVTDCILLEYKRDMKRPYVKLRIIYTNFGIHDLKVAGAEGYVRYDGERLERIDPEGGRSNVAGGCGTSALDVLAYVPHDLVEGLSRDMESTTREIRKLELNELSVKVYVEGDDTRSVKWNLGSSPVIFRRNW